MRLIPFVTLNSKGENEHKLDKCLADGNTASDRKHTISDLERVGSSESTKRIKVNEFSS
jgi:hypothetical protein